MWPFKRSLKAPKPDEEWWDRLNRVESAQRALELEWENTFEKIKRAMAKLGKRAAAIDTAESTDEQTEVYEDDMVKRGRLLAEARRRFGHNGGL